MNTAKLNKMLDAYYKDFDSNWAEEDYKWKEIKTFQNEFTLNSAPKDFLSVLKKSIDGSSNLVASMHYYPYRDLEVLTEKFPEDVQKALEILFDEEEEISNRIEKYTDAINLIKEKEGKNNTAYAKDRRFISTLLFFKYPEKYTIYKYTEDLKFCEEYELGIQIKVGIPDFIHKAKSITEAVAAHLEDNRQDILKKYREKLKDKNYYQDENLLLLAQNVIWYATTYKHDEVEETPEPEIVFSHGILKGSQYKAHPKDKGEYTDYIKEAKKYSKTGITGEDLVMNIENKKLKAIGKTAIWKSKDEGDGLGYDILSYNDDGSERYIEVKTTNGAENTMFFITATELEACKKYGENYYLYRVFKEKDKWQISWYRGKEVEALCNCPSQYAVVAGSKSKH